MSDPVAVNDLAVGQEDGIEIPGTPITPPYDVHDIPTIALPLTTATKAHIGGGVAVLSGAAETLAQFLPDGPTKLYISAGVAVVAILATWLGVYVAPNVPKVVKRG